MEDIVVFLGFKVFNSNHSHIFFLQKKCASHFRRKPQMKIISYISWYLIHTWSDKALGYRCESSIAIFVWGVTWNYIYTIYTVPYTNIKYSRDCCTLRLNYSAKQTLSRKLKINLDKHVFYSSSIFILGSKKNLRILKTRKTTLRNGFKNPFKYF